MDWLHPSAWWWAISIAVVAAIYLLRRKAPLRVVTTLVFFQRLHRHLAESPWRRLLKKLLSFLLVAGSLVALSAVLAGPAPRQGPDDPGVVVAVLDRSAASAAGAPGESLLTRSVAELHAALSALPPGVPVALVGADHQGEVLLPATRDRVRLAAALAAVAPRTLPSRPGAALALARNLAAQQPRGQVWWIGPPLPAGEGCDRILAVGCPVPRNAGITACALRRQPLSANAWELFIEVGSTVAGSVALELIEDDRLTALRTVDFAAPGRETLLLPVSAGAAERIHLHLVLDGDLLAVDDTVVLDAPRRRQVRVDWLSEQGDGFLALALGTLGGDIALRQLAPTAWPPANPGEVLICEGAPPPGLPPRLPLLVLGPAAPELGLEPLEQSLVLAPPRLGTDHPVLYGVASERLAVTQVAAVRPAEGMQELWRGPAAVALAAGIRDGRRLVLAGIDPTASPALGMTASWPNLLASAVAWLAEGDGERAAAIHPCGTVVAVPGTAATWLLPDGRSEEVPVAAGRLLLDRIGCWRCGEASGASALLAPASTALIAVPPSTTGSGNALGRSGLELSALLVLLALSAFVLESWACHRRGIF